MAQLSGGKVAPDQLDKIQAPGSLVPLTLAIPKVSESDEAEYRDGSLYQRYKQQIDEARAIVSRNERQISWRRAVKQLDECSGCG